MPRWVTIFGQVNHLDAEPGTQAYTAWACHLRQARRSTGEGYGSKQAFRVIHQPVSVVSQCLLIAWLNGLASGDQHRLTGSSSALEAIMRNALNKSKLTLLYFNNWFKWHNVTMKSDSQEDDVQLYTEHTTPVQYTASQMLSRYHRNILIQVFVNCHTCPGSW